MRFPIIDSHHHIWKQSDLDWLQGEIQPRIFGDYTPIKKDYLIDDFIEDVVDFGGGAVSIYPMQLANR